MKTIFETIRKQHEKTHLLKHEQIIAGIESAIEQKLLAKGDLLPSVNTAVSEIGIARKTVVKAYDELKKRGIVRSKKRLGYYIAGTNAGMKRKVMLLLNSLNPYQQELYDSIMQHANASSEQVDLFFHHANPRLFETIIHTNLGHYTHYIITPFADDTVKKILGSIPDNRLLLISRPDYHEVSKAYVIQNYAGELEKALAAAEKDLKKYKHLHLILSSVNQAPSEIAGTFNNFCKKAGIECSVSSRLSSVTIQKGHAYFIIDDNDLLAFLLGCRDKGFIPGTDAGVLSYNDSPMKELIGNGISTVSVDFRKMGETICSWLFEDAPTQVMLPTCYNKRNSL